MLRWTGEGPPRLATGGNGVVATPADAPLRRRADARVSRLVPHTSRAKQLRGAVRDGHEANYGELWRARLSTLPPRDGRSAWRAGVVLVISHAAHSEPAGGAEAHHPLQMRTRTPYLLARRRDDGSEDVHHAVAGEDLVEIFVIYMSTV